MRNNGLRSMLDAAAKRETIRFCHQLEDLRLQYGSLAGPVRYGVSLGGPFCFSVSVLAWWTGRGGEREPCHGNEFFGRENFMRMRSWKIRLGLLWFRPLWLLVWGRVCWRRPRRRYRCRRGPWPWCLGPGICLPGAAGAAGRAVLGSMALGVSLL